MKFVGAHRMASGFQNSHENSFQWGNMIGMFSSSFLYLPEKQECFSESHRCFTRRGEGGWVCCGERDLELISR